jgi:L-2,4-diaminobutyric acid acetyltransferase
MSRQRTGAGCANFARRNERHKGSVVEQMRNFMSDLTAEDRCEPCCGSQSDGVEAANPSLARPVAADGAEIWRLVRTGGTLELNSAYAYMLLGAHFGDTSVVARQSGAIVGFVWAYLVPDRPDTVFVWQIGVSESSRGQGLAAAMLNEIRRRPNCRDVRFLEATVAPSNRASMALFRSFARRQDAPFALSTAFDSSQFPDPSHETEMLVRIGPFHPIAQIGSNLEEDLP